MSALHSCGVRHIDLGGEGRCTECSFHVATQGHRNCCSGTAPIEPPSTYTDNFIENMRRRKAAAIPDEMWRYFGHTPPGAPTTSRPRPAAIAQPGKNPAYVAAAIRAELATLAALPAVPAARNDKLNTVAWKVFGFVKAGHADKQACWAELERIALAIGLHPSEITGADGQHGTLGSAWNGARPRDVPAPRGAA